MGNAASTHKPVPQFALPEQKIVNVNLSTGSRDGELQPVAKPKEHNVVAYKVSSLEKLRFVKSNPILAENDLEQEYQLKGTIQSPAPGLTIELYLCARLEYFNNNEFPVVTPEEQLGRMAGIVNQGPFNAFVYGSEVSWDVIIKPNKWPLLRSKCSIVVKLNPPEYSLAKAKNPTTPTTPPGSSLYVFWPKAETLELTTALRLVQTPSGTSTVSTLFGMGDSEATCVFCLCEPRTTAAMPCYHLCLCSTCTSQLQTRTSSSNESQNKCPICRQEVTSYVQINFRKSEKSVENTECRDGT